ncbi:MAG: PAS domain-containing sensor histidine kinase [Polyangiaceae bacterium]|nr:PAS domain-containing sensor histidine kinase [Polyangiaceae bacterium]
MSTGLALARRLDQLHLGAILASKKPPPPVEASEKSFRLLIEGSPDLIVVHRQEHIVYANPQAERVLGHSDPPGLVGKPLDTIIPEQGKTNRTTLQERWQRVDGSIVVVEVLHYHVNFNGTPATVHIARNVTTQNQATLALMEKDRMAAMSVLAAGVSHEISNPLAYVLANLDFIAAQVGELFNAIPLATRELHAQKISDVQESLGDAIFGAKRVRDAASDLRSFSRTRLGKSALVDVRKVLDASLRITAPLLRSHATVVTEYGDVPLVAVDEARLSQTFLTLLVNAAHNMSDCSPDAAHVEIRTHTKGEWVTVSISDTGKCIGEEDLSLLFEPFFTMNDTTSESSQGSQDGRLGLALCKRIVTSFGGSLDVASKEKTTFTVRLPVAPNMPAALSATKTSTQ